MQVRDLYNTQARLRHPRSVTNTKLSYAVKKNLRLLAAELKDTNEVLQEAPDNLKDYEEKRLALCEDYCTKDDEGKPVMNQRGFTFEAADRVAFEVELKPLQEKYAEALAEREKEVEALLDTEVTLDLHKVKVDDLPEGLNEEDMETILDIIRED